MLRFDPLWALRTRHIFCIPITTLPVALHHHAPPPALTCLLPTHCPCSFTSLWFLSTTTPSIYSLVGSLNKVPLALIGLLAFNVPWTVPNLLSILVGTAAGVVFVVVKNKS